MFQETGKDMIDLHSHSLHSDGVLRPAELVDLASKNGVRVFALTDHDTTAGLEEALSQGARIGVEVVPGIELSVRHRDRELHLLGLFLDHHSPALAAFQNTRRREREERVERICDRLRQNGLCITAGDVKRFAQSKRGILARPHVARALVASGQARSIHDAFQRWLGDGRPGFVKDRCLSLAEAAALVKDAGGLSFLAHPGVGGMISVVEELPALYVDGVEAFHPRHRSGEVDRIVATAERLGLLVSGGSDFHSSNSEAQHPGWRALPPEHLDAIRLALFERR